MVVLQTPAKQASQVKVRFLKIVDQVGGLAFSALIGWVLVCFTLMTLHTAPLARNFLFGSFQPREADALRHRPRSPMDRLHAGHVVGPLGPWGQRGGADQPRNVFDADKQFIYRYEQRRSEVENEKKAAARGACRFRAIATRTSPAP